MRICFYLLIFLLSACSSFNFDSKIKKTGDISDTKTKSASCSLEWFKYVETQVLTQDEQGHGPDLGSDEWQAVIEFKLGLQKIEPKPKISSSEWCTFIQQALDEQRFETRSSCHHPKLLPIETMICNDAALAVLDKQLKEVYQLARVKSDSAKIGVLDSEQIDWLKRKNACWEASNKNQCILYVYQHRIAELQARYQLIEALGPVFYVCDERPTDEISVTFYASKPLSLIADLGTQTSFMLLQGEERDAKYYGRNTQFWEFEGQAKIIWGNEIIMTCQKMH